MRGLIPSMRFGLRRLALGVAACMFLGCFAGCERRPLEDQDFRTRVQVRVNLDGIQNVTCDIYNDKIPVPTIDPEVMHVLFFDENGGAVVTESYISSRETDEDGKTVFKGEVSVAPGSYRMLAYNFGTETTQIRDPYGWETSQAYATAVPESVASKFATKVPSGEPVVYEPDHLVVAREPDEYIPPHTGVHIIESECRSVVESYYLQIKVDGLQYVSSATAVLSGMSSGNYISLGQRIDDPQSAVCFSLLKSEDKGEPVICAIFNTFGRPEGAENGLEVTFDLRTTDGRTVQKTFDISNLFLSENCVKHHWLLLDEVIKIDPPENPGTGGGFDPSVDDWDDEHHDIDI